MKIIERYRAYKQRQQRDALLRELKAINNILRRLHLREAYILSDLRERFLKGDFNDLISQDFKEAANLP